MSELGIERQEEERLANRQEQTRIVLCNKKASSKQQTSPAPTPGREKPPRIHRPDLLVHLEGKRIKAPKIDAHTVDRQRTAAEH